MKSEAVCVRSAGSRQPAHLLFASEDGKWLATANTDCEVHVYNLDKLEVNRDFYSLRHC